MKRNLLDSIDAFLCDDPQDLNASMHAVSLKFETGDGIGGGHPFRFGGDGGNERTPFYGAEYD